MKNILVIGVGQMAKIYADIITSQAERARLAGAIGNSEAKCLEFSRQYGVKTVSGGNIRSAVAGFSAIDAAIICTPEWIRREPIEACIDQGIPILLEKPLVSNSADLEWISGLAANSRKLVSVAHSLRFSPRFQAAKRAIEAGAIGQLRHAYFRRSPSSASYKRVKGKFSPEFWLSCHDIDLFRWLTGDEIRSLHTFSTDDPYSETSFLISHFRSAKGVHIVEEVSWCAPPLASTAATSCEVILKGTKGLLRIDDTAMNVSLFQPGGLVQEPDTYEHFRVNTAYYGLFRSLFDSWIDHIAGKPSAMPSFEEALAACRVCEAMNNSLKGRGEVSL